MECAHTRLPGLFANQSHVTSGKEKQSQLLSPKSCRFLRLDTLGIPTVDIHTIPQTAPVETGLSEIRRPIHTTGN